jgi:tRNA pseudouridine38-40 synthase
MAQGSKITEPTRTVKYAAVERQGNILSFRVCADGFLYNMVRIMAGTLYEVATGHREPDSIAASIAAQNRVTAGQTAPPHGLYLSRVFYERPDVLPAHWE